MKERLSIYRFLFGEYIYLYSYLLPLCGSFIVKVFSSLLLFFSFARVHAPFRSSFSILPRGPARPVRPLVVPR